MRKNNKNKRRINEKKRFKQINNKRSVEVQGEAQEAPALKRQYSITSHFSPMR